jgi:hypothetical protein
MPEAPPPLRLLLAAPPTALGVGPLLEAARAVAAEGGAVAVFFTDAGLAGLSDASVAPLERVGMRLSLCARSARAQGLDPARVPSIVTWSSLTAFLRDLEPGTRLWSAFP